MHENYLEILFVRQGSGIHTIAGKQYKIKKGDILIHNRKVLHDHYINSDTEISIYSCAISNVKIKGLMENSLIPD
jgi:quercetin dioxygenase-like cupin family protein